MDPIRNGRFAGLIGLLLLLHAALLTQILHRAPGQFLDVEEGFVAFAASEFLRGPTEVWNSYIYSDYETGTLFVGLLTAQSFRLFGENVLALKLVSIGLSLVTVATTVLLGARLFDRVTGLLGGLFVALGPAPWLIRGIQTLGDSSEGVLFILLQWLVWTFLRSSSGRRRAALGVLLGLVCGMGLAFSLATLPSLLLIVLALISCRRELGHTSMGGWFAGLLLGLSLPLYNLHTLQMSFVSWRGMPLHQMIATPEEWWGATRGLLSREKLNQFSLGLAVSEGSTSLMVWVLRAYWLTVLAAWVACFWPARKNPADRLLVSLHGVYLAAYVFNRHANPYLLLLIAIAP